MAENSNTETPESPEVQEDYVREDLDQDMITHKGDYREAHGPVADGARMKHLGATDDEVVPIVPPMAGPADLVGKKNEDAQGNESGDTDIGEESVDPRDHLTPG